MKLLTEQDYKRAADRLGCDVPAVKAVAEVESAGSGFLADGHPKILFERHIFRRQLLDRGIDTARRERERPDIVNAKPGGYVGGAGEWQRLDDAVQINRDAALASASWGKFQILGLNWRAAGADSLQDFVNRMYRSEGAQLDAFVEFVITNGLDEALREHDWARFARGFNGPAFAKNRYDTKMAAAHERHGGVA